jgi:hypothetical protein
MIKPAAPSHPAPAANEAPSAPSRRLDLAHIVRTGAIFPLVVITCIGLMVLTMLGYLVNRVITNHGLLPPPTAMQAFACAGFDKPFVLEFRHGLDVIRLRTSASAVDGSILNGHIAWSNPAAAQVALGFVAPTEVVYDDARSLRVLGADQSEKLCQRQP